MSFDLIADGKAAEDILAERQRRVDLFTVRDRVLAESYVVPPGFMTAVNVALSLGRPLLLTGEPGTGKTSAALWLAWRLGLWDADNPTHYHKFQVRSDSRARDLCYHFDAVSWFREGQRGDAKLDKAAFISWRPLGIAFGANGDDDGSPHVVLIDEVDKAPRDFPNDLLEELERMEFTVQETGQRIGPPKHRPIIIITSNAERRLPEPFLRRCLTHNIEITEETAVEILQRRLGVLEDAGGVSVQLNLIKAGATFWSGLNKDITRKPSIAEFWQWLALASEHAGSDRKRLIDRLKSGSGPDIKELPFVETLFVPQDLKTLGAL